MNFKDFLFIYILFLGYSGFAQVDTSRNVSEKNPYGYLIYEQPNNKSVSSKKERKKSDDQNQLPTWSDSYVFYKTDSADYKKNVIKQGGIGLSKLQNDFLSQVTYSGISFRKSNATEKFIGKTLRRSCISLYYSTFSLSSTGNSISEFGGYGDYSYLIDIKHNLNRNFVLYLGPTSITEFVFDMKSDNTNNPYGYRYSHSLDISSMLKYRFKTNRYFALSFFVDFPLLNLVSVPGYASTIPQDMAESGGIFNAIDGMSFVSYTRLRTIFNVDFSFFKNKPNKSGSTWRVTWMFEGGKIDAAREYGYSNNVFLVGRVFRLYNL